jgi:chromosome segregation ATPase
MTTRDGNKNPGCVKCDSKGLALFMCYGCQKPFCWLHTQEHRQELSAQIDTIEQEHDLLQQSMSQQSAHYPALAHIDQWGKESIMTIQMAAEAARTEHKKKVNDLNDQLQASFNEIKSEVRSSRESCSFSEIDITRLMGKLTDFRQKVEISTKRLESHDPEVVPTQILKLKRETRVDPYESKTEVKRLQIVN